MRVDVDQHGHGLEGLPSGHFKPPGIRRQGGGIRVEYSRGTGRQGSAAPLNCGTWWLKVPPSCRRKSFHFFEPLI